MLGCNVGASPWAFGGPPSQSRSGQAILSFKNISTADGMALGAIVARNSCSSVQTWTKRTSGPRWMPALSVRKMGSILKAGAISETRFHLGIFLITRTRLASPFASACRRADSCSQDTRPTSDTTNGCNLYFSQPPGEPTCFGLDASERRLKVPRFLVLMERRSRLDLIEISNDKTWCSTPRKYWY